MTAHVRARHVIPLLLSVLLSPALVGAQSPHDVRRVELVFEGAWDEALAQDIRDDLASAHALLGVPSGSTGGSLVRIVFARAEGETSCRITATNALTERELTREVSLEELPPDSLGVVLAAAADELVAATWPDDTTFHHVEPPPPPPPPAPPPPPPPPPPVVPRDNALGVHAALEHHTSSQLLFGGDLRYARLFAPWIGIAARLGFREALPEDTARGRVRTRLYALGAEVFFRLLRGSRALHLDAFAQLRGEIFGFRSPADDAIAGTHLGYGVSLRGGARLVFLPRDAVRPVLEASVGGPLVKVFASDGAQSLTGAYGFESAVTLGAEWAF